MVQSVCPLMLSRNTYRLTWVSLTLDVGYLFMAAPAKRSCCSIPRRRGISSRLPPWPWTWSSSSWPSCACAAAAPCTWGSSSWQAPWPGRGVAPLSCSCARGGLARSAAAPDFGRGVAPQGHTSFSVPLLMSMSETFSVLFIKRLLLRKSWTS